MSLPLHNCENNVPLAGGSHKDGERWTCPDCGKTWVHVTSIDPSVSRWDRSWWEPPEKP